MARITRNITSNVLNFVVSAIIPLLLTPFVIHRLGDSHYGLWILINSVIGYYGLLDLGIASSVIRYVSKYVATDDAKNLNSFVNTVLTIFALVSIVIIIVSGVLSFCLADLFNISEEDSILFSRLVLVLGFAFALSFPARTFSSILRAIQRYDIANAIDISCSIAKAGAVVYFLSRGGGLLALALIALFINLINGMFSFFLALRKTPMLKLDLRLAQRNKLRTVFGYSIFMFIWGIGDRLRFHMDSLVIGKFLSAGAITHYIIGAKLMTYYLEAVAAFGTIAKPMFSSMEARGQSKKIQNLLINGTRLSSIISVFLGTCLILYGKPFISLWVGVEYESSYYVMLILIVPYIITMSQNMSILALQGMGRPKFLALVTMGEGGVNLVLSVLLIRRYGIYGVALGTAIPLLITMLFILPIYICRVSGLPVSVYISKGLLRQFIVGILYVVIARTVAMTFYPNSYSRLFLSVSVGFIFFVALAAVLCITRDEMRVWRGILTTRLSGIHAPVEKI